MVKAQQLAEDRAHEAHLREERERNRIFNLDLKSDEVSYQKLQHENRRCQMEAAKAIREERQERDRAFAKHRVETNMQVFSQRQALRRERRELEKEEAAFLRESSQESVMALLKRQEREFQKEEREHLQKQYLEGTSRTSIAAWDAAGDDSKFVPKHGKLSKAQLASSVRRLSKSPTKKKPKPINAGPRRVATEEGLRRLTKPLKSSPPRRKKYVEVKKVSPSRRKKWKPTVPKSFSFHGKRRKPVTASEPEHSINSSETSNASAQNAAQSTRRSRPSASKSPRIRKPVPTLPVPDMSPTHTVPDSSTNLAGDENASGPRDTDSSVPTAQQLVDELVDLPLPEEKHASEANMELHHNVDAHRQEPAEESLDAQATDLKISVVTSTAQDQAEEVHHGKPDSMEEDPRANGDDGEGEQLHAASSTASAASENDEDTAYGQLNDDATNVADLSELGVSISEDVGEEGTSPDNTGDADSEDSSAGIDVSVQPNEPDEPNESGGKTQTADLGELGIILDNEDLDEGVIEADQNDSRDEINDTGDDADENALVGSGFEVARDVESDSEDSADPPADAAELLSF